MPENPYRRSSLEDAAQIYKNKTGELVHFDDISAVPTKILEELLKYYKKLLAELEDN